MSLQAKQEQMGGSGIIPVLQQIPMVRCLPCRAQASAPITPTIKPGGLHQRIASAAALNKRKPTSDMAGRIVASMLRTTICLAANQRVGCDIAYFISKAVVLGAWQPTGQQSVATQTQHLLLQMRIELPTMEGKQCKPL